MFHLLGFLFIIIIAVVIIGLTVIGSVLRAIFGFGHRPSSRRTTQHHSVSDSEQANWQGTTTGNVSEDNTRETNKKKHSKKIFAENEGEYVDYEEVK